MYVYIYIYIHTRTHIYIYIYIYNVHVKSLRPERCARRLLQGAELAEPEVPQLLSFRLLCCQFYVNCRLVYVYYVMSTIV